MKVCPKCHRSYGDEIDFCLRDGKPLVKADAASPGTASTSPPPGLEPPAAPALRVKTWDRGDTSSSPSSRREAPWAPNEASIRAEKNTRDTAPPGIQPWVPPREVPPPPPPSKENNTVATIAPWVPGQVRESSVSGIRLTMPVGLDTQAPPWESAQPIPLRKITVVPPEPTEATPGPAYSEPVVLTPDLPVPPPEREDAVPVGDETILVVEADEEELELDGLELEEVVPPPEPELPLEARYTKAAAIVRSGFTGPAPGPPVEDDDVEFARPRLLIHTEDVFVPPEPDDEDAIEPESFVVYWQGKRVTPFGESLEPEPHSRWKPAYLWVAAIAVVLVVIGFLVVGGRNGNDRRAPTGPGDRTAQEIEFGANGGHQEGSVQPKRGPEQQAALSTNASVEVAHAIGHPKFSEKSDEAISEKAPSPKPTEKAQETVIPAAPKKSAASGSSSPAVAKAEEPATKPDLSPSTSSTTTTGAVPAETEPTGKGRSVEKHESQTVADAHASEMRTQPASKVPPVQNGTVVLHSVPSGANVLVDGRNYGRTPVSITAPLGRHRVRVEKAGYRPTETVLNIDRPEAGQVSVSLDVIPAQAPTPKPLFRLMVSSNVIGADVFIDGQRKGSAPLSVVLEAGSHKVKVVAEGKPSREETVTVVAPFEADHVERRYFQF